MKMLYKILYDKLDTRLDIFEIIKKLSFSIFLGPLNLNLYYLHQIQAIFLYNLTDRMLP